jgi:hypothetical protein
LLSYVITLMAERLEEVAAFRREVLGEKLLTTQGVELWIKSRSEAEGFSVWLEVPYSSSSGRLQRDQEGGLYVEPPLTISKSHPATDVEWRWLAYSPPATVERRVKTAANGALERLRILSANVAREVGCEAGEAAVFILSGQPLPFYPCRQTVDFVSADQLSALNRIELCIDPALSPREVSIIYRQMRGKIFGRRRHRNMSEKHIRLALFTMARGASEPLKRAIEAWNKLHPKWRYRQESNFGRDRIVALRRVVDALDSSPASKSNVEKWLTKLEPDHAQGSKTHQRRQRK